MTAPHLIFHTLIRWLDFLGVAVLIGGIMFRYLVIPSSHSVFRQRGRRLMSGAFLLISLMSVIDLGFRARMMSPTMGLGTLIPLVILRTHLGHVWLFKAGLLVALLWLAPRVGRVAWGQSHSGDSDPLGRPWAVLTLAVAAALGLAQALSGHAADRGNLTFAVLADWLHVVATATWFGGLIWLRVLLPQVGQALVAEVLRRFSRVAATSVVVLVLTGLVNAAQQVAKPAALLTTAYGQALVLKVLLVAAMVALGGLVRTYVLPGLTDRTGPVSRAVTQSIERVFGKAAGQTVLTWRGLFLIGLECLLGMMVLWCAAVLTQTPPPRAAMMLNPPHVH